MQQSSATPIPTSWFLGVAEDCCMLSILELPSCFNSFWHGVIPTSYFIFNDFYTCHKVWPRLLIQELQWDIDVLCDVYQVSSFLIGCCDSELHPHLCPYHMARGCLLLFYKGLKNLTGSFNGCSGGLSVHKV